MHSQEEESRTHKRQEHKATSHDHESHLTYFSACECSPRTREGDPSSLLAGATSHYSRRTALSNRPMRTGCDNPSNAEPANSASSGSGSVSLRRQQQHLPWVVVALFITFSVGAFGSKIDRIIPVNGPPTGDLTATYQSVNSCSHSMVECTCDGCFCLLWKARFYCDIFLKKSCPYPQSCVGSIQCDVTKYVRESVYCMHFRLCHTHVLICHTNTFHSVVTFGQ